MAVKEEELEWSATSSATPASKPPSRPGRGTPTQALSSNPATVRQARLDAIMGRDPTHSDAYCHWICQFRTSGAEWTDEELGEAFLILTKRIKLANQELQAMDPEKPGGLWVKQYQANQKRAGKRDAIMEELRQRSKPPSLGLPAGNTSNPGSSRAMPNLDPESDPFALV